MSFQVGDIVIVEKHNPIAWRKYYLAKIVEVADLNFFDFSHEQLLVVKPLRGIFRRKRIVKALWVAKLKSAEVEELERMVNQ